MMAGLGSRRPLMGCPDPGNPLLLNHRRRNILHLNPTWIWVIIWGISYLGAILSAWVLSQSFPWPISIIAYGVFSVYAIWHITLMISLAVAFVRGILDGTWREWRIRTYLVNNQAGINRYLYRRIDSGGRVAIWTRDMSWAEGEKMAELLRRKAQRGELIICLPQPIPKSDELKQIGAEVFAYGTDHATDYRFIIVNYGRAGSRIAVFRHSRSHYVLIREYSADEHPAFQMAHDLVRMVQERPDMAGDYGGDGE